MLSTDSRAILAGRLCWNTSAKRWRNGAQLGRSEIRNAAGFDMMQLKVTLIEPVHAHRTLQERVWPLLKASLIAGHRMTLEIKPEGRTLAENAMLHALLSQISREIEWAGQKRDVETWKRLLTAAWCRASGEQIEVLPALDGHGVDIVFRKTSKLNKAECAELIDFVQAWAVQNGIKLQAPEYEAMA